jgi:hypothetical protein
LNSPESAIYPSLSVQIFYILHQFRQSENALGMIFLFRSSQTRHDKLHGAHQLNLLLLAFLDDKLQLKWEYLDPERFQAGTLSSLKAFSGCYAACRVQGFHHTRSFNATPISFVYQNARSY